MREFPQGRTRAPKVFITWAHQNTDWDGEQAKAWLDQVHDLATVLRVFGIDADVDLWHLDEPGIDWTRYGPNAVDDADFVLIAVSEAWRERWAGRNAPTEGAGAAAEADALRGLFQEDQEAFQQKAKVVVLPGSGDSIPRDLRRLSRFSVDPRESESLEELLRMLTGQPRYIPPELGTIPLFPPAERMSVLAGSRGGLPEYLVGAAVTTAERELTEVIDTPSRRSGKGAKALEAQLAFLRGVRERLVPQDLTDEYGLLARTMEGLEQPQWGDSDEHGAEALGAFRDSSLRHAETFPDAARLEVHDVEAVTTRPSEMPTYRPLARQGKQPGVVYVASAPGRLAINVHFRLLVPEPGGRRPLLLCRMETDERLELNRQDFDGGGLRGVIDRWAERQVLLTARDLRLALSAAGTG